ncbi:MAG TPA: bifunctional glutamate N-acetyltransferase/amino-acid acetyltransferase ArgJ [Candidatus Deferrimicrobium sp.]|nr:bifunctional glutamate N-acetyltransferase/amino-acid acetyltransferase ArgJ [Candidatus Deferrimicrobium sp.]
MKKVEGGVCAPKGFVAGAAKAGIKYQDKYDVAIIASEVDAALAGVFTTNKIQAAPVVYSKQVSASKTARGVVVNSGNANACTAEQGMTDCTRMAEMAADILGVDASKVAVASTGVIGVAMPIKKVLEGIRVAGECLTSEGGEQAALALMTTDTYAKQVAVEISLQGKPVRIGGVCKGSGMIHPNMATMLGFITTDAVIDKVLLQQFLQEAVAESFNMITVDGDTSTNDMVLIMANGLAGNSPLEATDEALQLFKAALNFVCRELAQLIARDGEGATKFLEVEVAGANTLEAARKGARGIVASSLVKAAFYGEDANWGRIICALGYSGADFEPASVDIYLGNLAVAKAGRGLEFSEAEAKQILGQKDIKIRVDLNQGQYQATAWGCDLSHEYVTINGDYRT